jgi:hypothetical protein
MIHPVKVVYEQLESLDLSCRKKTDGAKPKVERRILND